MRVEFTLGVFKIQGDPSPGPGGVDGDIGVICDDIGVGVNGGGGVIFIKNIK